MRLLKQSICFANLTFFHKSFSKAEIKALRVIWLFLSAYIFRKTYFLTNILKHRDIAAWSST